MLHLFPNIFYALLLIEGLDLDQNINSTNKTYFQVNKPNNQVISDHTTFPKKKLILEVDEETRNPLKNYWKLKLFKHSSKARLIIAAPQCSSKTLSKALANVLILTYKQIETCNSEITNFGQYKATNLT